MASICETPVSAKSKIFKDSVVYGLASFAASSIATLKAIAVARWFGTSPEMDAYTLAILVPNLVGSLLGGTTAGALVPTLFKATHDAGGTRATIFRSTLALFTIVCLLCTLILVIFPSQLCHLLASNFDEYRMTLAIKLMRYASGLILLSGIYAFCSAELLARKQFWLVAGTPAISTVISLLAILIWHRSGVEVLVWSLELGSAVQTSILVLPAWRSAAGGRIWAWRNASVWRCLTSQAALLGASSIGVANVFIDQTLSAHLPAGNVSALSYANSLNSGFMQIVVMALSWVALPDLAAFVVARRLEDLRRHIRYCMLLAVLVATPASVAVIAFGYSVVRIVFEHGLFTPQSTHSVFLAWVGYSLGLVPAAIGMIVVRLVNAMGQNLLLFKIGLLLLVFNAVLDYYLMQRCGLLGISLSTTLVYCVSAAALLIVMRHRVGAIIDRKTGKKMFLGATGALLSIIPPISLQHVFGSSPAAMLIQSVSFVISVLVMYSLADVVRWTCNRPYSFKTICLHLALEETL